MANRVKALVATSALGMGFDKPDLGFVVHLGSPSSPPPPSPTTSRWVARAEVSSMPRCCCSRAGRTRRSGSTSHRLPSPRRSRSGGRSMRSPRPAGRSRCLLWSRWSSCGAPAWRPCSRSSTSTVPSSG
ncbi:hypothetical protein [Streptomyces sp. NPDC005096]|uniref:hypothetical protein n=1 Tax=Streptomyces sp. NPDC005096 TaxID=3154559 RepID=UPI0033AD4026